MQRPLSPPEIRQVAAPRSSLGSTRELSTNMASEIYKADTDNQIETNKILWEVRFLQSQEDLEKQLVAVEAAMSTQVGFLTLFGCFRFAAL